MNPKFPIYIISKGRWKTRYTSIALESIGVDYRIVIEPHEFAQYASVIDPQKILVLPFSNLGQGGIPARNWVWEHSISEGHGRHWIMDDNLRGFVRLYKGDKIKVSDGSIFAIAEGFVERYMNVHMAGFQYGSFAVVESSTAKGTVKTPFCLNARIYSCILLSNKISYRWRGRYNEDTDLSLRILKDGHCTILFNGFLCNKQATLKMKGGNTDLLYKQDAGFDGRLEMAKSLQRQHPDVCTIRRRWGRWQHHVNYKPFKKNRLIRKPGIVIPKGINNYGMKLVRLNDHPPSDL